MIGAPVYVGRIPTVARERFSQLEGNDTPCLVLVTYGNRDYDDALLELSELMTERGFLIKGAAALDCCEVSERCLSCFRCVRNCPLNAKCVLSDEYQAFAAAFSEKLKERKENQFFKGETTRMQIRQFTQSDTTEIIALVLHCQNDGTRPIVTVEDQADLLQIQEKYISSGGNFWVAVDNEKIAASIGLMNYGNGVGILKKFFVYEAYRGAPYHLGRQLYQTLLEFAEVNGFKTLILDTPKNTDRAHKFYEKAGFEKITKEQLDIIYDYPYDDSDFFRLQITK